MERELSEIIAPIAEDLREVPDRIRATMRSESEAVQPILDHLYRYQGKLLRPALVLLAGSACRHARRSPDEDGARGRADGELLQVAAIVEMVHVATLVHDDVLDEASVRRRVTSVNARYGNQTAVLLGDYLYARAFHQATRLSSQTCSTVLSDVTRVLCEGEIEEIRACFDFAVDEERYLRIIGAKTASLYGAACRLGALYSGGGEEQARALEEYGYDLGLGFQIVDDCLDLSGVESVVGKSLGTDIVEGKITLPIIELMKTLGAGECERLEAIYRDRTLANPLATLHGEFDLRSAIEKSLATADVYLRRAQKKLVGFPECTPRDSLLAMPEYILCRKW